MVRASACLVLAALILAGCKGRRQAQAGQSPVETPAVRELRARGKALFAGRGGCMACHKLGAQGDKARGPNLGVGDGMTQPVGVRARARRPRLQPLEYVVESILDPDAYTVAGYAAGVMPRTDEPPISLGDDEVLALAAFLAGEATATPVDERTLAQARARMPAIRTARAQRVVDSRAAEVIARLRWDAADLTRGAELFGRLGCSSCHGDPRRSSLGAPDLAHAGARLSRETTARWVLAPPTLKMPRYTSIASSDLADVTSYVVSRR